MWVPTSGPSTDGKIVRPPPDLLKPFPSQHPLKIPPYTDILAQTCHDAGILVPPGPQMGIMREAAIIGLNIGDQFDHLDPASSLQRLPNISDVQRPSVRIDSICQESTVYDVEPLWPKPIIALIGLKSMIEIPSPLFKITDTRLGTPVVLVAVFIFIVA